MMDKRNGENGLWRLMRLGPVVIAIISVIGMIYIMNDDLGEVQATTVKLWNKYNSNKDSIVELEKSTGVIEYRLEQIDDALDEQKTDLKEILREVRK